MPENINAIEQLAHLSISIGASGNCENGLPKFSCEPRYPSGSFSLERLPIQAPFACNHKIEILHFRFKIGCFRDDFEARPNFRAAKTHQAESESAGRACARFVAIINAEFF